MLAHSRDVKGVGKAGFESNLEAPHWDFVTKWAHNPTYDSGNLHKAS